MMCSRGRAELVAGRYRLLTAASGSACDDLLEEEAQVRREPGHKMDQGGT
jgi:hypothetical protein